MDKREFALLLLIPIGVGVGLGVYYLLGKKEEPSPTCADITCPLGTHCEMINGEPTCIEDPPPTYGIYAGWRSSQYGLQGSKPSSYWVSVAQQMATIVNGVPTGVWVVGEIQGERGRTTQLTFSKPPGTYPNVVFTSTDRNEAYLDAFDANGIKVWLQVESADADVEMLIDLMFNQYGHHPCVIGFGVDVEWYHVADYSAPNSPGKPVSNTDAQAWLSRLKSHNSSYKLFLKHWLTSKMPSSYRHPDLVFISDSQGFNTLSAMINDFSGWASHFSESDVGFQIGYSADRNMWNQYVDPPRTLTEAIINTISNCKGVYWVDFTITEVFP